MRSFRFALLFLAVVITIPQLLAAEPKHPAKPITQSAESHTAPAPTLVLNVDATHVTQNVFHMHETIPVSGGPLTLYYPKWIPGEHMPSGPIADTAGITFTADGKTLDWQRDKLDMFEYHIDVPKNAKSVEVTMDYLSPVQMPGGFSAGSSTTAKMAVLSWNQLVLYPKGWNYHEIHVIPSLTIPQGWHYGTALPLKGTETGTHGEAPATGSIEFADVSLTRMVDSPVIMGAHLLVVSLDKNLKPSHEMDIAADSDAALQMTPEQKQGFNNLVAEANALFQSHHYRDYHFLLSLSNHVAHFGLEHHESDDSRTVESFFTNPSGWILSAALLPHEYVHSWNGKYRRPYDLATDNYDKPMQDDLLWVYEGLTEYFGYMLTARSGMWTPQQWRDTYADLAMTYSVGRPGRKWRPLVDTATAAQLLYSGSPWFANWRRGVDYYDEGALIWLEADIKIRQLTHDQKSIDDFAHIFYGPASTGPIMKPYTFDDVVNTLNEVAPYDWSKFLRDRIYHVAPNAPLGGIEDGGWKIVYTDKPNQIDALRQRGGLNCTASIGLIAGRDGRIIDTMEDGLAFKAGMGPGMQIVAVNGRAFTPERLYRALEEGKTSKTPLELLVESDEYYKTYSIDYHDGPRYPHLVRNTSMPDLLDQTIKPLASAPIQHQPEAEIQ